MSATRAGEPAVTTAAAAPTRFQRDRLTWSLYSVFVTWGWFLYAFSPAVPLIADEQGTSRATAGLHGTAMALGAVATGLVTSWLAVRLGRRTVLLAGCGVIVLGIGLLLVGTSTAATLTAVFLTAVGGNLTLAAAQPALSVHHGRAGPAALTEANGAGATVGLLAPLAVGLSVGLGWGWRPAVALVILLALVCVALVRRLPATGALGKVTRTRGDGRPANPPGSAAPLAPVVGAPLEPVVGATAVPLPVVAAPATTAPATASTAASGRRGFGRGFWFFWAAMVCGVAIEFATTFWAPALVVARTGAPASVATATVSALVLGMAASRFVVGPLSTRKAPEKLLLVAYAVSAAGWLVMWLATTPAVAMAGLVLAGFGLGAHYPLSISLALRASGGRPDAAQAWSTVGAGAAIALAPLLLGFLADTVGAFRGFVLVPILMALGAAAVAAGYRAVLTARA